jgi:hypothetical protein
MIKESKPPKLFIVIAGVGILFVTIVFVLFISERITIAGAIPLLIVGMMVGFVPLLLAGMKKK